MSPLARLPLALALSGCARAATAPPVVAPPVVAPPEPRPAPEAPEASEARSPEPTAPICPPPPSPAAVTEESADCPDPASLTVVHRWRADRADEEPCGPPAWVASLGVADPARFFPAPAEAPRSRALTDAEARALASPLPDGPLWVFAGDGAPCQATPGRVWVAERQRQGPPFAELGRALYGCDFGPSQEGPFYALSAPRRPTGCRFRPMTPRVDRSLVSLPAVRARTLGRPCVAPSCRFAWSRAVITQGAGTLDDVQAVYIFARPGSPPCASPRDWYHALTWTPRRNAPWARLLATGPAAGLLVAGGRAQAVITAEGGRVEAFPLSDAPDLVYPAASLRWFVGSDEDSLGWTIQPRCR
jgi:hypothetical protein